MILESKHVLVIGATGVLGRTIARAVVVEGGKALLADVNTRRLDGVHREVASELGEDRVASFAIDITSRDSIQACLDAVQKRYERLDGAVNAAYPRTASWGKHFFDVDYGDFCENVNMQLGGAFLVVQQLASFFSRQGFGSIVSLASVQGVVAPRFETYEGTGMTSPVAYSVVKAGLVHLTRYVAKYLKGKNVRVNAVSPGGILDGQPERFLQRYRQACLNKGMLEPGDVVGAVLFLLSDMSAMVNGQNFIVDDGFTL